ncbi:phenylalanine--tRNA ligase subunit alpha [Blochmannia endosymbiont of Polyrhachis (Hedomyrma) turneri]|uniref:phenylalanine--tRNA ligase subunit alpha n=1 Tax=Blochmannia endosymbiont of Polyrhachis (Hedomyrma) turneri TaxID=1505596 RepID=UPI00061A534A|nr:phenylalanine--tRNA ligase subunit alpha [Blochmannia endosymbiont of Polyrhachis (Hedomyrma) turneri]AKC59919.1 Phenylalanine--tRNA ligase alpha subunit [Blochmannia endosymbiont of Polyrhachis (Hedomyrma) turneri]
MLKFLNVIEQTKIAINKTTNLDVLEFLKVKCLGRNGHFTQKIKTLRNLPPELRSKKYKIINKAKKEIEELIFQKRNVLQLMSIDKEIVDSVLDISLPGRKPSIAGLHPITHTMNRVILFFKNIGFSVVYGPEIENSYYNFDALNIPDNHPARNEQDTFWIDTTYLLRTQTSGMQIRVMQEINDPPIMVISPGRVYRKDYDKYHTPMFHQIEGLVVDKNISFSNLKYIMSNFLYDFFTSIKNSIKIRFRPSYFPFTAPSAEIDILLKNYDWLEILGCGMVHPHVLNNVNIDPKIFSGFAFGIGIERLAMLYYDITDLRLFFENDLRFLKQFK